MHHHREALQKKFETEYQQLNENQKKAVDTIEGPVMVIAGPGTGKTQILASRIGKILLETDTSPENILCLTYTEAGTVAMRKRLLQFIGPDAYKVNIYTFHAFCNDIIQENLPYFKKNELNPIADLEKISILKELIDELPKNSSIKRYLGNVYYDIPNLSSLFDIMKKEGWTPEFLNQKIDEYLADIPTRDKYIYKVTRGKNKKGDLKQASIDIEVEKMARLRGAVNEFSGYQEKMYNRGLYDFNDMITWVIEAFENNPQLLLLYQEKYQYILVDEYQDTSGTQNKLIELLINYWEEPNIFVVGDDDQSIFRFQGANVFNMTSFVQRYGDALQKIILSNNYRSSQPILDISKGLIDKNEERLVNSMPGLTKKLISSNKAFQQIDQKPAINQYKTPHEEMIGIATAVRDLINEGVAPGEIGIIYRNNQYGLLLSRYLNRLNIPVYSKRSEDLLNLPLIKKIILLLRYLDAEHDVPFSGDEMLFEILHFSDFHIAPIEIAKISIESNNQSIAQKKKVSIREIISKRAGEPAKDLFSVSIDPALENASKILETLILEVSNIPLLQILEALIQKTGILSGLMNSVAKHEDLKAVTTFFHFVRDEAQRDPDMRLPDLVKMLDLMKREGVSINLVQVSGNDKAVNLLTAHGAKGLEFEHVFFAGCNASFWESRRGNNKGFSLPDTVFSNAGGTDVEELRRLFYVALTRAKKNLQISYASFKNDGKELEASRFIAEIQQIGELPINEVDIPNSTLDEFAALLLSESSAPEIAQFEKDFVDELLSKFVMNATALNNFLKCPLEFYFKNLVRIPSAKNESLEFGSAVHYALEQLFRKMLANEKVPNFKISGNPAFPPIEEFISDFEWFMKRHRESFTLEQFNRRLEYGHEVLTNYYHKYISSFHTVVSIEQLIRNIVIDGVPIKGKLDKMEFYGNKVVVVDYKTGTPDNATSKLVPPDDKQPDGGDYWRQAVFYKLLVDHFPGKNWEVEGAQFDFIEPNKKKEYIRSKVNIGPADLQTVRNQIVTTWNKIQAHDFYTGCGKPDCHWCNFVKENNLAVALHEIKTEEEEE